MIRASHLILKDGFRFIFDHLIKLKRKKDRKDQHLFVVRKEVFSLLRQQPPLHQRHNQVVRHNQKLYQSRRNKNQKEKEKEPTKQTQKEQQPKSQPKQQPKDTPKDQPKQQPKDQPKQQPKDAPKDQPKQQPKDQPKQQPKQQPKKK